MKYSHNYSKLDNTIYTTIRRYHKGNVGNLILETYPAGSHYAKIIKIERKSLDAISLMVLKLDTDLNNRTQIYDLFQSFYQKPIDFANEKFYLYYIKKVVN